MGKVFFVMRYCFRALPRDWIASDCPLGCGKGDGGLAVPLDQGDWAAEENIPHPSGTPLVEAVL